MRVDGPLEVSVLGPLEVRYAGTLIELPQGRSRAVLGMLALNVGQAVATARLIDELWGPAPPATVVTALHGLVSGLRKRVDPARDGGRAPSVLATRPPGYLLALPPAQIDARRFRALVGQAMGAPAVERAAVLSEALRLWRGPVLADVEWPGPVIPEIAELDALRMAALEERIDADLACGRHRELVGELESLVADHPYRERLYGQLMLAHYRSGGQAAALDVYRRARAVMVEQVGVEPGPALRTLQRAVLEQDAALEPPTAGDRRAVAPSDQVARAGELLAAAASRVYSNHYDTVAAEELFRSAEQLLPPDHPQRQAVLDRLPEMQVMLGRHSDADTRLKEALAAAQRNGDSRREAHLRVERARIQLITGPDPIPLSEIETIASGALSEAERAGDDAVVSQATYVLGLIEWRRGRMRSMEALARRGLVAAERSGSTRERLAARWWVAIALVEGPTPTDDAIAQCEELVELGTSRHLGVLCELARLHGIRGDHGTARQFVVSAEHELQRRDGLRRPAMFVDLRAGEVANAAGDLTTAEQRLRAALATANALGEPDEQSQIAAKLARLLAGNDPSEAADLADFSRSAAPAESVTAQALWRAATAAVRGRAGDEQEARELLEDAVDLVPPELVLVAADLRSQLESVSPAPRQSSSGRGRNAITKPFGISGYGDAPAEVSPTPTDA